MRVVVQRVKQASVSVNNHVVSQIEYGFLLLVGLRNGDDEDTIKNMALKISKLRIFSDDTGLMNLNIHQIKGQILSISQFTLYGDVRKQNRPGFTQAMKFDHAKTMYALFNDYLRSHDLLVKEGVFGEHMEVSLINDGPVTLIIDTSQ